MVKRNGQIGAILIVLIAIIGIAALLFLGPFRPLSILGGEPQVNQLTIPGDNWPYAACPSQSRLLADQYTGSSIKVFRWPNGNEKCTVSVYDYPNIGIMGQDIITFDLETGCDVNTYCVNPKVIQTCPDGTEPDVNVQPLAVVGYHAWSYATTCTPKPGVTTTSTGVSVTTTVTEPPKPAFPNIDQWIISQLSSIWSWIRSTLGFSIVSNAQTYSPGSTATFQILLPLTGRDSDCSDGVCNKRYGLWFISDANEKVIQTASDWEEITSDSWAKSISVTLPTTQGDYYLIANVINYDYHFSNGAWVISNPASIQQDATAFKIGYPEPPKPITPGITDYIGSFLSGIWSWIKGIFGAK